MYANVYFALPYYANADFATYLHYVYVFVYVYVYDLKREVRDTRTADEPPAPQHSTFGKRDFFRIRHYRSSTKQTLIFFILTLDNSAGWLYI